MIIGLHKHRNFLITAPPVLQAISLLFHALPDIWLQCSLVCVETLNQPLYYRTIDRLLLVIFIASSLLTGLYILNHQGKK